MADVIHAAVSAVAGGKKIDFGQHTVVTAEDTVVTGLASVVSVMVVPENAPTLTSYTYRADIGDQAGAPAAGSFILRSYKPTAANDATPTAASDFAQTVNWIACGT